ncbi:MAG: MmgE/PrpD family protein [Candidatus Hodarchaeota archaeon]
MSSLSAKISEYFCKMIYDDIPQEKIEDIKRLTLDYLGVACKGSSTVSGRIAIEYVISQRSQARATIIGSERKAVPMLAAFANAISSHSIELDDVDDLALYHFSPSILSAALAIGEQMNTSGRDLLTAIYAGCEMMARLSNALNPSLRNRGFHTTPVCGIFGATVSAGLLLRLEKAEMKNALGLAGAQCSGLMEFYGESLQKRFNPGPAARNGIVATEMAKLGYTGSEEIFEGKRGLLKAFSDNPDETKLTESLGEVFPVFIDFKPYACARPIHNGIDCALAIRKDYSPKVHDIQNITIYRHPDWVNFHLIYNPKNINEAQVSLPFSVAVALKEGGAFLDQYDDQFLTDPDIKKIMDKIRIEVDPELPRGVSCLMTVETRKGETYETQVDYAKGSKRNPITDEELIEKFKELSTSLIGTALMNRVIDTVLSLDGIHSIEDLTKHLRKGHSK